MLGLTAPAERIHPARAGSAPAVPDCRRPGDAVYLHLQLDERQGARCARVHSWAARPEVVSRTTCQSSAFASTVTDGGWDRRGLTRSRPGASNVRLCRWLLSDGARFRATGTPLLRARRSSRETAGNRAACRSGARRWSACCGSPSRSRAARGSGRPCAERHRHRHRHRAMDPVPGTPLALSRRRRREVSKCPTRRPVKTACGGVPAAPKPRRPAGGRRIPRTTSITTRPRRSPRTTGASPTAIRRAPRRPRCAGASATPTTTTYARARGARRVSRRRSGRPFRGSGIRVQVRQAERL